MRSNQPQQSSYLKIEYKYKNCARRNLFIWYSNLDSDTQISSQCCVFQLVKPALLCTSVHSASPKKEIENDRCRVVSRQFALPSSLRLLRWSGTMPPRGSGLISLRKAQARYAICRNINNNKENCQQTSGSSGVKKKARIDKVSPREWQGARCPAWVA